MVSLTKSNGVLRLFVNYGPEGQGFESLIACLSRGISTHVCRPGEKALEKRRALLL